MFKSLKTVHSHLLYFFLKPTHNDRAVNKDVEKERKLKRTKKKSLVTVSSQSSCINHCLTLSCSTFKKRACHAKAGRNLYECILKFGYTIIQQKSTKMNMMQMNILIPFQVQECNNGNSKRKCKGEIGKYPLGREEHIQIHFMPTHFSSLFIITNFSVS